MLNENGDCIYNIVYVKYEIVIYNTENIYEKTYK